MSYRHIAPEHEMVHSDLLNWARWLQTRPAPKTCMSLEGNYRSPQRNHYEPPSTPQPSIQPLRAAFIETTVSGLPSLTKMHLKLWYVHRAAPGQAMRMLGMNMDALEQHIWASRQILVNRLRRVA